MTSYRIVSTTTKIMEVEGVEQRITNRLKQLGWAIKPRKPISEVLKGVPEGERNESAFNLARYLLHDRRLDEATTWQELQRWNEKNKPPLPLDELKTVFEQGKKYPWGEKESQTRSSTKGEGEEEEREEEKYIDVEEARDVVASTLALPEKEMRARQKYMAVTQIAWQHFEANGRFYFDPKPREAYWFDAGTKILFSLDKEDLKTFLSNRLDVNREDVAFRWVLSGIKDRCAEHAPHVEPKRCAYYDYANHVLYYNHKPGRALRLDGESITEIDNGDPVLFLWDEDWQPVDPVYGVQGMLNSLIFSRLLLDDDSGLTLNEATMLTERWVLGILFRSKLPARPILALIGPQGSGKTVFCYLIGAMLFGKSFSVLGVEAAKQDGAIAYITNSAYAVFDNADESIPWLPDMLARTATGQSIPRRKLYTTNELVKYPTDLLLAITARQTPWARPDVIDRLFLFLVKRPEKFLDEEELKRAVLDNRPQLIGELLAEANEAVKRLKGESDSGEGSPMRLSAFYNFATRTSSNPASMRDTLDKMIATQENLSYEQEEALLSLLKDWVQSQVAVQETLGETDIMWTDEKAPSEIFSELGKYAKEQGIRFMVKSSLSLGHLLRAYTNIFRTSGIFFKKGRVGKGVKWSFGVQRKVENKPTQPTHPTPTPPAQVKDVKEVKDEGDKVPVKHTADTQRVCSRCGCWWESEDGENGFCTEKADNTRRDYTCDRWQPGDRGGEEKEGNQGSTKPRDSVTEPLQLETSLEGKECKDCEFWSPNECEQFPELVMVSPSRPACGLFRPREKEVLP
jgi:hypothetical protein